MLGVPPLAPGLFSNVLESQLNGSMGHVGNQIGVAVGGGIASWKTKGDEQQVRGPSPKPPTPTLARRMVESTNNHGNNARCLHAS